MCLLKGRGNVWKRWSNRKLILLAVGIFPIVSPEHFSHAWTTFTSMQINMLITWVWHWAAQKCFNSCVFRTWLIKHVHLHYQTPSATINGTINQTPSATDQLSHWDSKSCLDCRLHAHTKDTLHPQMSVYKIAQSRVPLPRNKAEVSNAKPTALIHLCLSLLECHYCHVATEWATNFHAGSYWRHWYSLQFVVTRACTNRVGNLTLVPILDLEIPIFTTSKFVVTRACTNGVGNCTGSPYRILRY